MVLLRTLRHLGPHWPYIDSPMQLFEDHVKIHSGGDEMRVVAKGAKSFGRPGCGHGVCGGGHSVDRLKVDVGEP